MPSYHKRRYIGVKMVLILVILISIALIIGIHNSRSNTTTNKIKDVTTTQVNKVFGIGWQTFKFNILLNSSNETVVVYLSYPTYHKGTNVAGATPDLEFAPYPMIVFSQGFGIPWQNYTVLLNYLTEHGFVVAYVIYPYTDPNVSPPLLRSDIINHPYELSSAVNDLLDINKTNSLIKGLINVNEIGLAGQSDGGDVSLTVAVDSEYKNPLFKAVALYSAAEYNVFSGTYFSAPQPPLLITQGTLDDINPPYCSIQIYNEASSPKYYIELVGADHLEPYTQSNQYESVVAKASLAFFNTYLKKHNQIEKLHTVANLSGVSQLINSSYITPTNQYCPGAP